jgi:hypothetical protein
VTESYNLECTRTPEGSYLMDEKPAKTLELYPYISLRGSGGVVEFGLREVIALASSGAMGALLIYGCQKWIKR